MKSTSKFSYTCNRCRRCCTSLEIAVNPYDVARLAEHKNLTTTEFNARYVDRDKQTLLRQADGSCVFLTEEGCSVHEARPLPCRLYPLARKQSTNAGESFAKLTPDPQTKGEYGTSGTIADYLKGQDIERHINFADKYFVFFSRLLSVLRKRAETKDEVRDLVLGHLSVQRQLLSTPARAHLVQPLLELDSTLDAYCRKQALPRPDTVDARAQLHLLALEEFLTELEK